MSKELATYKYQGNLAVGNQQGLKGLLDAMKPRIAAILPKHIGAERVLKAALTATIRTPKLLGCTQESWMESLMRASQLGLDCSGTLGAAYLVPYGQTCTFIPGYRGLIDLARRSGKILSIEAHPVYSKDKFRLVLGTSPVIEHQPYLAEDRGDTITCFYAVARLADGGTQVEHMTLADVRKIQAGSKAGRSGPWVDHFAEMGRKTVVRRICKYLPMSAELEKALEWDNEADGIDMETIDVGQIDVTDRSNDLAARLAKEPIEPPAGMDPETGEVIDAEPDPQTKQAARKQKAKLVEAEPEPELPADDADLMSF